MLCAILGGASGVAQADTPARASRSLDEVLRVVIKSPCFDRDSLADEVAEWLGRSRVDSRVQQVQVRASQGTLTIVMVLQGEAPLSREFTELPRECEEQRRVIALSIAMAVDALEADLPPLELPDPALWHAGAHGLVMTSLPLDTAWGLGVDVERTLLPFLGLRIGAAFAYAHRQALQPGVRANFDGQLGALRTELCLRSPVMEALDFGGCGGMWVGSLGTAPRAPLASQIQRRFWWAAAGSLELRVRLASRVRLVLTADLLRPLRGGSVQVHDAQGETAAIRDLPRFHGVLRLGPVVSF